MLLPVAKLKNSVFCLCLPPVTNLCENSPKTRLNRKSEWWVRRIANQRSLDVSMQKDQTSRPEKILPHTNAFSKRAKVIVRTLICCWCWRPLFWKNLNDKRMSQMKLWKLILLKTKQLLTISSMRLDFGLKAFWFKNTGFEFKLLKHFPEMSVCMPKRYLLRKASFVARVFGFSCFVKNLRHFGIIRTIKM